MQPRRASLLPLTLVLALALGACGSAGRTVTRTVHEPSKGAASTGGKPTSPGKPKPGGSAASGPPAAVTVPTSFPAGPRSIHILADDVVAKGVTFTDTPAMDVSFAPGGLVAAWYDSGSHSVMYSRRQGRTWSTPEVAGHQHGTAAPMSVSIAWDQGPVVVWSNPAGGGVSMSRQQSGTWSDDFALTGSYDQANATVTRDGLVIVASQTGGTRALRGVVAGSDSGPFTIDTGAVQGKQRPLHVVPAGDRSIAVTWTGPGLQLMLSVVDTKGKDAGFNGPLGVRRASGGQVALGPGGVLHLLYGGGGATYWRAVSGTATRTTRLQSKLSCDPGGFDVGVGFQAGAPRLLYGYGCDVGWSVHDVSGTRIQLPHETALVGGLYPVNSTTDGTSTALIGIGASDRVQVATLG